MDKSAYYESCLVEMNFFITGSISMAPVILPPHNDTIFPLCVTCVDLSAKLVLVDFVLVDKKYESYV